MDSFKKTIYIVRHAKSDWKNADQIKDIDRPLNTRGVQNAYEMSARLAKQQVLPHLILSSNGIRALHTAVIFAHQLTFDAKKIQICEHLYHATSTQLLTQLQQIPETIHTVMLFAHNPGIEDFVSFVNKTSFVSVPTCAIAHIETDAVSWKSLNIDSCNLVDFDFPKKNK